MLSQNFIDEMKQKLEQQQAKFEADLAQLQPHTEMGDDYENNAIEVEVDEVNRDLIVRIESDLEKVKAALSKIEQGTYGIDAEGNEISEDRLRAIPWADKAI